MLIHNAILVDGVNEPSLGWLTVAGERIESVGRGEVPAAVLGEAREAVDAEGAYLMPGAIDCHVHMREPGLTRKGSMQLESADALAGGVTSVIDMPNTKPATLSRRLWEEKMDIASRSCRVNYAFMVGASDSNIDELQQLDFHRVAAVKVFMGSSTGNMLLDDDAALRRVFAEQPGRVVVHAEDQHIIDANIAALPADADLTDMRLHSRIRDNRACVAATERAMELASRYGTRLHIAHVSTREECALLTPSVSPRGKQITAEVSPHHLLFCTDDYARLGSLIKINPAVKSAADREALRRALVEGRLDIVASDHAPHELQAKAGDVLTAASGAPMVRYSLVKMLDLYDDPTLVVSRMALGPALLYGITGRGLLLPGAYADLALVARTDTPVAIDDNGRRSPLKGTTTRHIVRRVWVNGGDRPMPLHFD